MKEPNLVSYYHVDILLLDEEETETEAPVYEYGLCGWIYQTNTLKEAKEHIKDHINRLENNIKEKYVTAYKQKNLAQVIFSSNNNSPLAFSFDERKFAMFKCGNKNKGKNKEYWEPLNKEFRSPGKINHL